MKAETEPEMVSNDTQLEVSLKQKLDKTTRWEGFASFTHSRLPSCVRERHKDIYEPRVVSIGPFHRGKESLSAMEAHKARCLIDFLDRNSKVGLEVYVQKIRELEDRARCCYSEAINLNRNEFVEMLLLDGCFILEFFYKIRAREPHMLLDVGWGIKTTISDLLLFENQIPFFVIEALYALVDKDDRILLLHHLEPYSMAPEFAPGSEIVHLLHLYYQWFIPNRNSIAIRCISIFSPGSKVSSEGSELKQVPSWARVNSLCSKKACERPTRSIPSATELHEAGVTFRKKEAPRDVFDITFEKGVMEIPTIMIDSFRTVYYLNLVAFEQSSSTMDRDLGSYITLMNSLIKTNKDVVFLQRCGIINNMLLSDEEMTLFFNQCGTWSTLYSDDHYFASLFASVQQYFDSSWHRYRAKLMHDYFNSPWSALSIITAIVLLIFSAIQAVGTIIPLYIHH